jgi:hypothetical protein
VRTAGPVRSNHPAAALSRRQSVPTARCAGGKPAPRRHEFSAPGGATVCSPQSPAKATPLSRRSAIQGSVPAQHGHPVSTVGVFSRHPEKTVLPLAGTAQSQCHLISDIAAPARSHEQAPAHLVRRSGIRPNSMECHLISDISSGPRRGPTGGSTQQGWPRIGTSSAASGALPDPARRVTASSRSAPRSAGGTLP